MKNILLAVMLIFFSFTNVISQNVGIGTNDPFNRMQVEGNFLITAPSVATTTAPTAGQTITMVNNISITIPLSDSVIRFYDPGGAAGVYLSNMLCYINFLSQAPNTIGIEITVEAIDIGTGDSLLVKESSSSITNLVAVGNGYNTTGKWVINDKTPYIVFKSNADGNNGSGFSILVKRMFKDPVPQSVVGIKTNALFFDVEKAAFRSGVVNNSVVGLASIAMGEHATASGTSTVAIGKNTMATGNNAMALGLSSDAIGAYSTAIGYFSAANGDYSTAIGSSAVANGERSIALGHATTASGNSATALGYNTDASGYRSTAMGNYVSTNNVDGTLVIGDNSTTTVMNAATANSFRARFDGGYRFFTSSDLTTNAWLPSGSNAWSTSSDVRLKENFAEVDGEDFLRKIAAMKLVSWNYKKQDAALFRHYGPMAQDFYAAFGKDKYGRIGNDTTINQADFDGVNMIAIQALEKRTALQQTQLEVSNKALKKQLDELKTVLTQLQNELKAIKRETK